MTNVETIDNERTDVDSNDVYGIEEKIFPLVLKALQLAGIWKPTHFLKNLFLNIFYNIYSIFCIVSIIVLMVTIIIDNVLSEKSVRDLIENMYLILTIFNGLTKLLNVYLRKSKIIRILQRLIENRWSDLRDDTETRIIEESIYSERYIARVCLFFLVTNDTSNALNPILHPDPEHDLMVDAYSICDRSRPSCYWSTYAYQVFGYVCTSLVHVGCDNLFFNLTERICAQLRILEHRLLRLPELVQLQDFQELSYLKECIKDHQNICETIKDVNDTFYEQVFVQFLSSISVLCTNIYLLSIQNLFSAEFIGVFLYLCCALVQNFFYCWYGYKVLVNSLHISDAIFNMNWCILQKESNRMLTFIMLKTSKRVYLCKSAAASLTPESFVNIAKLSYSAFNILQQTSKK